MSWAPDISQGLCDRPLQLAGIWRQAGCRPDFLGDLWFASLIAAGPANRTGRTEIEAQLLSGRPPKRIALQTGCPVGVVRWFAAMWFDVRGRLDDNTFIHREVLQTHLWSRAQLPAEWLLKAMAYVGERARLDELWAVHQMLPRDRLITVDDYLAPTATTSIQLRGWIRYVLAETAAINPPAPDPAEARVVIDIPPQVITRMT